MWNKRPDEDLSKSYNPAATGTSPATPNPMDTPTVKTDVDSSRHGTAVIGKAVKIVGEIYSSEDLLVEGFVQGTVEALDQKLTVGRNGTLHASVQVRQLDVQGTVQGNVEACERVDIRKDASLIGNIRAARINIEDGAYFKGSIDIVTPEAAVAPPPARPAAAPARTAAAPARTTVAHSRTAAVPASPALITDAEFELVLSSSR
jgi:cytoskeletal protein CcmA (bactofilin family)